MSDSRRETSGASDARSEILESIRRGLAASRPFDAEHEKHHKGRTPVRTEPSEPVSGPALIDEFRASLNFVGADCRLVVGPAEAAAEVESIVKAASAKRIAVSDSPLVAELLPRAVGAEILKNAEPADLFGCDIGITSAQWGIAETGTLILESERESHRLTSLVPPVHICILRAANIRRTLGEILELVSVDLSPAVTFVTGASRTSDIELTLAIGVHGPKELHVIVLDDIS